jgi:hypothetical protein
MHILPQVIWRFFKARAKGLCVIHTGRASNAEKSPNGRGPSGWLENGPSPSLLLGHVSPRTCSLLAPWRRAILKPTEYAFCWAAYTSIYEERAKERAQRYGKGKTYLDCEHGWGKINCKECGFVKSMTASVHICVLGPPGQPPGSLFRRGAQCQTCGKVTEIDNWDESKKYHCECSGILTNSNPLFCEQCRSTNVHFETTAMTGCEA